MTSIAAAILLGVALIVAGGSKIAMGRGWSAEAASLGAPSAVIPVLPWIEISIGALLVVQWQRRPVAIVALGLLVAFTGLIAVNLARGNTPPCACFGSWSVRPLGWRHFVRNVVLIACAIVAFM